MRIAFALIATLILSVTSRSAENGGGMDPKAMEALLAKMQPGKEHEELKKLEGKYDVAAKMWMDPSQPAQESKGTAEFTMVMNGRYLKQDFKGEMMGKPYNGVGFEGFDKVANKFVSMWMDDVGTQPMMMYGESKDGGKTVEFEGEHKCPMTGQQVKMRAIHKQVDADKFIFEMYHAYPGQKEFKGMELTYTRKK